MGTPENNSATIDAQEQLGENLPAGDSVDWKAKAEKADKRRRDTQAAYTQARQELAAVKAQLKVLQETGGHKALIDKDKLKELEDLKFSDPDAWFEAKLAIEADAKAKFQSKLSEAQREVSEIEIRQAKLEDFKATHPGFELSDDDIPPRIAKKLASGQISFDEFLVEVYDYVSRPKVFGDGNRILGQPDLSVVGGGNTPSEAAKNKDIVASYRYEVY